MPIGRKKPICVRGRTTVAAVPAVRHSCSWPRSRETILSPDDAVHHFQVVSPVAPRRETLSGRGSRPGDVALARTLQWRPEPAPMHVQQTRDLRPVVALLESRMQSELARLVEKHGGAPLSVPAVREAGQLPADSIHPLLTDLT